MKPVLSFRKVDLRRGNTLVLSGLDLEVYEGETVVLLGRSGSGKTSALKLINALLERTAGELDVFDKPIGEWNPIELRRRIGYVIQEVGLLPHFTVEQNIGLVPYLTGWPPDRTRDRVRELMLLVGLDPGEFASRFPSQLSGGQRQRVGITRALAASPSLLLLDEPFGALDPVTRLDLQREFLRLREVSGVTSVFVTHDVQEAMRLGTRIGLLHEGKLEVITTPEEFQQQQGGEAAKFLACLH